MTKKYIITIITFLFSAYLMFGQSVDKKYSIAIKDKKLVDAIQVIKETTGYNFSYRNDIIKDSYIVSINITSSTIEQILDKLLKDFPIDFRVKYGMVVLKSAPNKIMYTISGVCTDITNGELLLGATVFSTTNYFGASSNSYGFYSLKLPVGKHVIVSSYIGYSDRVDTIEVDRNLRIDVKLNPVNINIKEIEVVAQSKNRNIIQTKMNTLSLPIKTIMQMPAMLGELDVMKSLQMLPGVQSGGDVSANLNVRGGKYDENLIILDDAPIYNPSHALGFFSVFNPEAIKDVTMYKGSANAQYGGRASSVVDIRMKDGNMQDYQASASLGTVAANVSLQGPIVKDKASFIISGRYSYAGFVADNVLSLLDELDMGGQGIKDYRRGNDVSFYDINLKLNTKLNNNNRLYYSLYSGHDNFHFRLFDEKSRMEWGNNASTLRWNHIFNDRLFANTTASFSKYNYSYTILDDLRDFEWLSSLNEFDIKQDFDFFMNSSNRLKFGAGVAYHSISPGQIKPRSQESITKPYVLASNLGYEPYIYASHEVNVIDDFTVELGLRYSAFINTSGGSVYSYSDDSFSVVTDTITYNKGDVNSWYSGLEPRLNLRYTISDNQSVKMSYARNRQYLRLLSSSGIGLPTDVWFPVNKHIKPQISDQVSLGYFHNLQENKYEISAEIYYKNLQNQIDFRDNSSLFLNPFVEQEILSGRGWSYGAEFLLKLNGTKLSGWLAYTWSKTENKIKGINNGEVFPSRNDKRHDISMFINYKLSKKWAMGCNFVYSTGSAVTAPKGSFSYNGIIANSYTERNGYRLPDYHRLDFSATRTGVKHKRWQGEWVISIYNVYSRQNAYSIYNTQDSYDISSNQTHMIYMFGVVPSITYKIKFN